MNHSDQSETCQKETTQSRKEFLTKEQVKDSSKLEPTTKALTPQELQQKFYSENLKANKKVNPPGEALGAPKLNPGETAAEPGIAPIVAAIEAGFPFVILLDNGKQVALHASKLSQPAILGLMIKFAYQLLSQETLSDQATSDQANG